ncbi:helix-turn-helix transcriptional regulator [Spirosoma flavum]|uniref:Helix-turn-helix transcriptional regulator n=1 Tax=Spirosoma flavum TaxID=2048557 RepID=A0ABW6AP34_9BACT
MKKQGAVSDLRLKRIFEIHKVLRKTHRGWSAEELCELCREVDPSLNPEVDKRTTMNDLKFLREVLQAPLPERANKHHGYYYSEPYSILEGLDDSYLGGLNEALALLRQLSKSKEFIGLEDLLLRLEQRITLTSADQNVVIEFDEAELIGREHLIGLYQATQKRSFLRITYKTFQGEEPMSRHILPLLLKQYNNRWVLIGWENGRPTPQNLPLDRIKRFYETAEEFVYPKTFKSRTYFQYLLGTTKTDEEAVPVVLHFSPERSKYVETKMIHPTQETTRLPDGRLEVRLLVELNRELDARILEFGRDVTVIAPSLLRERIKESLIEALRQY